MVLSYYNTLVAIITNVCEKYKVKLIIFNSHIEKRMFHAIECFEENVGFFMGGEANMCIL